MVVMVDGVVGVRKRWQEEDGGGYNWMERGNDPGESMEDGRWRRGRRRFPFYPSEVA